MDKRILEQLTEKFENVLEKPGGKGFKYISSDDVFERMNKVFQGNWNTEVLHQSVEDDQVLVRVRVMAKDPTDADSSMYFHEGFASQPIARYSYGNNEGKVIDTGNTFMAAMSKAVKQACKKWGVASGLDDEEVTISTQVTTNPVSTPGPASMSTSVPKKSDMSPRPEIPKVPSTHAPTAPPPPPVEEEKAETTPTVLPPTPPPTPATPTASLKEPNGNTKITDVQKIALQGLLTLRGLDYTKLATDAFENKNIVRDPLPQPEDLDYDDAVIVIKYGNDLFRKNK